jgi:hypothetical protein
VQTRLVKVYGVRVDHNTRADEAGQSVWGKSGS